MKLYYIFSLRDKEDKVCNKMQMAGNELADNEQQTKSDGQQPMGS